jgi:hypothetical protein
MRSHRKKIFVVGTGRSGTCWLGDIMGRHPEVRSYVETQPLFSWVTQAAINLADEVRLLPDIFDEYERLFHESAPFHLADKSHPCIWFADKLADRFPDAYFLGVTRDVEPTVSSMLQHPGVRGWCEQWHRYEVPNRFLGITELNLDWYREATILERCVARWYSHQCELKRIQSALPSRFMLVKYEQLVIQPVPVLEQLGTFLGLEADFPAIKPLAGSLTKWKAELSISDVARIRSALEKLANGTSSTDIPCSSIHSTA